MGCSFEQGVRACTLPLASHACTQQASCSRHAIMENAMRAVVCAGGQDLAWQPTCPTRHLPTRSHTAQQRYIALQVVTVTLIHATAGRRMRLQVVRLQGYSISCTAWSTRRHSAAAQSVHAGGAGSCKRQAGSMTLHGVGQRTCCALRTQHTTLVMCAVTSAQVQVSVVAP